MKAAATGTSLAMGHTTAWVAALVWSLLVLSSVWVQREQLDRTAASLARIDAVANLRKDMAIRKWASAVGGVYINDERGDDLESLDEQERLLATRGTGESLRLVAVNPIHLLLAIQETSNKEYGSRERLTSQQLRNLANRPDDWETKALEALKGGSEMVAEALPKKGGHGLMRVMIPMRMEEECLECHRDTLVPVGGLRGGAAITVDLNAYRTAQEPAWRTIQYWHLGIWLLGLTTIYAYWRFARRGVRERALQDEERRENETAFAAMAEGAIITDASGRILWVNDAFCRIYGYQRQEVIGQNPRILKSGRHDAAFYQAFWQQLAAAGHWRGELWNRRKTGEIFPEELSIQALRGPDGRVVRYISIFSDITERKKNEEELRRYREGLEDLVRQRTEELTEARDAAEAASRSKSTFLANMSHELRTPLNAVIGFAQLMERDPGLLPAQRRNLEIIDSSGNHLLTLINDVLELSKIESGKEQLAAEEVAPAVLLRQVVDMMRVRAEQAGLELRLETRDLPPAVLLDAVKLRQVLLNLLSNAIKFTPAGQVRLSVEARPRDDGRLELACAVADSGIGIDPADQERIFEPFEQAAPGGRRGGTGLGLPISRHYVEMMGGRLTLESAPGQGSCFRFAIPAMPGGQPAAGWRPAPVIGLRPGDRGRRILVVDDQPEARLLVRSLLEPLGFQVVEAADGPSALEAAARLQPELVFLDWRLPGLDGLEAARRIRARGAAPRIVMLTAHVLEESRRQALAAGVDDFLGKPFGEDELFAAVEQQLNLAFERGVAPAPAPPPAAVDLDRLKRLDPALRAGLDEAALSLRPEQIAAALAAVAGEDPQLAAQLRPLAEAMDYPGLWRVLEIHPEERP